MIITIGRGRTRKTAEVATGPYVARETRERQSWDMKQIMFNLGIIKNLG